MLNEDLAAAKAGRQGMQALTAAHLHITREKDEISM